MPRSIIRYVNLMDRAALRGEDPGKALQHAVANLIKPGRDMQPFVAECMAGYSRRLLNRERSQDIVRAECQICARQIGYAAGEIAHHGYQRPGGGWQTPSCFGAHRLSYDLSHDALDKYVEWLGDIIKSKQRALESYMSSPPDKLTHHPSPWRPCDPDPAPIELTRPDGFDPNVPTAPSCYSRLEMTYGKKFHTVVASLRTRIDRMTAEVARAKARITAWKPRETTHAR